MIPIEVLRQVSVVYCHAKCPDGLASAMILKDAFRMLGTTPRIQFLVHNTKDHRDAIVRHYQHSQNGRALFCDIAPHPDIYRDHVVAGDIVLDHHIGAKEIVEAFGELGVFAHEDEEPGVSGAVLAFREVWEPVSNGKPSNVYPYDKIKDFAECVGVRDTWQTEDPRFTRGQYISKRIMSSPGDRMSELGWLARAPYLHEEEINQGRVLFENHMLAVRQTYDQVVSLFVGPPDGVGLYVFQEQAAGHRVTSDVAEMIRSGLEKIGARHRVLIAGFSYVVERPGEAPRLVYSLRQANGFDVCAFAKANGGGGHTKAAGFSVELEMGDSVFNPYDLIRLRLHRFLSDPHADDPAVV